MELLDIVLNFVVSVYVLVYYAAHMAVQIKLNKIRHLRPILTRLFGHYNRP